MIRVDTDNTEIELLELRIKILIEDTEYTSRSFRSLEYNTRNEIFCCANARFDKRPFKKVLRVC